MDITKTLIGDLTQHFHWPGLKLTESLMVLLTHTHLFHQSHPIDISLNIPLSRNGDSLSIPSTSRCPIDIPPFLQAFIAKLMLMMQLMPKMMNVCYYRTRWDPFLLLSSYSIELQYYPTPFFHLAMIAHIWNLIWSLQRSVAWTQNWLLLAHNSRTFSNTRSPLSTVTHSTMKTNTLRVDTLYLDSVP